MDRGKRCVLVLAGDGAEQLGGLAASSGVDWLRVTSPDEALTLIETKAVAAVFVPFDARPNGPLRALRGQPPSLPLIAFGEDSEKLMRAALAEGAIEYLPLPLHVATFTHALDVALASTADLDIESALNAGAGSMVGASRALAVVKETIARVAGGTTTVLIRGETGTGKELVARAVHAQSPRFDAPFVKVHAAALPDALLESELFGYERGAFTGATQRKPGRVEMAEHGTLFLDEIAEISPVMQAKLLRLVQDREYECLGGTRTRRADIRLIAATHRDLEDMVRRGAFREDLFYRLNVVTVWLPPLRARPQDIAPLVQHYLAFFREQTGKPQLTLSPDGLSLLERERWPGNIRQLVNFIERLVVLTSSMLVSAADVRRELDEQLEFLTQAAALEPPVVPSSRPLDAPQPSRVATPAPVVALTEEFASSVRPLREDVRRTELRAITKALKSAKGNRALAARLLGVSRRTLYTKLEEHGIE